MILEEGDEGNNLIVISEREKGWGGRKKEGGCAGDIVVVYACRQCWTLVVMHNVMEGKRRRGGEGR